MHLSKLTVVYTTTATATIIIITVTITISTTTTMKRTSFDTNFRVGISSSVSIHFLLASLSGFCQAVKGYIFRATYIHRLPSLKFNSMSLCNEINFIIYLFTYLFIYLVS